MAVILVVDDDDVLRQVSARILEANGHEVYRAHGGFAALLVCQEREGAIDLVITNAQLPDMAGWELIRLAQATQPRARAVYVANDAVTDSSDATLRRPFSPEELLDEVHKLVGAPRPGDP
jgi:two-component system cell cycle sensor histidine kinase/response regulator CckA